MQVIVEKAKKARAADQSAEERSETRGSLQLVETISFSSLVQEGGVLLERAGQWRDVLLSLTRLQFLLSELSSAEALASAASACVLSRKPADLIAVSMAVPNRTAGQDSSEKQHSRESAWTDHLVSIVVEAIGDKQNYRLDADLIQFVLRERKGGLALDEEGRSLICVPIRIEEQFLGLLHVYYERRRGSLPTGHLNFCAAAAELLAHSLDQRHIFVRRKGTASESPPSLAEMERRHITHVLAHTQGSRQLASLILGIDRSTLHRKIEKYQIDLSGLACHRAKSA